MKYDLKIKIRATLNVLKTEYDNYYQHLMALSLESHDYEYGLYDGYVDQLSKVIKMLEKDLEDEE